MDIDIIEGGERQMIRFSGDIDLSNSDHVRRTLVDRVAQYPTTIVDLSGVGSIDSSGVASLVEGHQLARKRSCRVILAACGPTVLRVLQLAKLDDVFDIADTVDDAVKDSR